MITEKYDQATAYAGDVMSSARDYLHRGTDQVTNVVDEQPGRSMMIACLAGFGVGLLLTRVLTSDESSYSSSSSAGFDRHTAERLGRNLLDRIEHALPSMLRDRLMK